MKLPSRIGLGAALAIATGLGLVARALAQDALPSVDVRPAEIKFSSVAVDRCAPRKYQLVNISEAPAVGVSHAMGGSKAFSLGRGFGRCPDPLQPGGRCGGYIDFCPLTAGTHRATLVISYSGVRRTVPVVGRARNQGGR